MAVADAVPLSDPDALIERLTALIGGDAALVVAVAVMGFSRKEAGHVLGFGHDAARKRYQRAIVKLREELGDACDVPF
ncbi:hypothetical protein [Sinisalibacter aestuarii]|uniref:hypothetical protein n=1 Tax=Sinisalibacter aestuarii TaxID=2949426 RepID=UPI00248FD904|nr:hypothetical protein [Sinisalibacter aestuarii]